MILNDVNNAIESKALSAIIRKDKMTKLIGTYLKRKGLKLYAYNSLSGELEEVIIKTGDTVYLIPAENGGYTYYDPESQKCNVDGNDIHFEALNDKTAKARLQRYKDGKINDLCNLRKIGDKSKLIDMFS